MKNKWLFLISLFCLCMACQEEEVISGREDAAPGETDIRSDVLKGEVYIRFKERNRDLEACTKGGNLVTGEDDLDSVAAALGAREIKKVFPLNPKFKKRYYKSGLHLWYKLRFDEQIPVTRAVSRLKQLDRIASVCPVRNLVPPVTYAVPFMNFTDGVAPTAAGDMPYNDPMLPRQWHYRNPGSDDGRFRQGADINLFEAWKLEKGKPNVIVTVVGNADIDEMHEDLKDNIWRNEAEINGEAGVDDDGNGYVDDFTGLHTSEGILDDHETFISGIIAAKNNNALGGCGIAGGDSQENGVRIMNVSLEKGLAIYQYATDNGAVIAQNSWSFFSSEPPVEDDPWGAIIRYFIQYAGTDDDGNQTGPMKGGIVVFAAGNEGSTDYIHMYPGGPFIEGVVNVSAFTPSLAKSGFSNYGEWINVCAPGGEENGDEDLRIFSINPGNSYGGRVGTSHAAPHASGVLALMVSKFQRQGLTAQEILRRFYRGCRQDIYTYNPIYKGLLGAGNIDAALALSDEPLNDPPVITPEKELQPVNVIYGQSEKLLFHLSDPQGDAITYTVKDPTGAISDSRTGDDITLMIVNRDATPGRYTATLTAKDVRGDSAVVNIIYNLEEKQPDEVLFWPTSVQTRLFMRMARDVDEQVTVRFYNAASHLVYMEKVPVKPLRTSEIRLYNLNGGLYTVTVECSKGKFTRSIIKI